ncbi:MAG: UDP-N-acetylmuramoyl-tripeptide--D-alanyl-D-alanine ligase [Candidatus Didemnitutus sp.]|nr:UDP-N-acetylmuramoyl-tripeptide--D-alanyl-D-alanine ligase [Candidatus Didemnitutus sp.]
MPTFSAEKIAAWSGGRWTRLPGGTLVGFNQDTRSLNAGQIFVALQTEKRDGHDFVGEAQAKGAAAGLVSRKIDGVTLPQLVVADPLVGFQKIAAAARQEFTGPVVGVTGSAGKTSTKDLLAILFGGEPEVCATAGNLNNHIGIPLTLTRLDPAVHRAAVIEAGINMPGEMQGLADMIQPDHAIVTLVGPAHLEQLGSLEGVADEKVKLLTAVRAGGLQVFPVSCWQFAPFRELANSLVLVPADAGMVNLTGRSLSFTVLHRPERTEVTLGDRRTFLLRRVSGGMAQNTALALALASELGVDDPTLQERLETWVPSKWRGELQRIGEADVYCDFYNANPASMQDAIAAFAGLVKTDLPRLYVLGGMEELGAHAAQFHHQLGRTILLRPGDFLCALGDHAMALREGLLENGNDPEQIEVVTDLAPVRARLAAFRGAAFLKGSRRYRLETILDPHDSTHA